MEALCDAGVDARMLVANGCTTTRAWEWPPRTSG